MYNTDGGGSHMEKLHEYLPGDSRERIQDLLIERKMTQAQLAEKLEISRSWRSQKVH